MKRLLAYLIVVISLGLTFNVNAEAKVNLDGFMQALEKAKDAGLTIDAEWGREQNPFLAADPHKVLLRY